MNNTTAAGEMGEALTVEELERWRQWLTKDFARKSNHYDIVKAFVATITERDAEIARLTGELETINDVLTTEQGSDGDD